MAAGNLRARQARTVSTLTAVALAFAPAAAIAQQQQSSGAATPGAQQTAGDVNAAAAAFEEGQRAQIARDYARAAELFEIAYRSAPDPAALRSAIRNHRAVGHNARAATLALRARERYGSDAPTAQLAESTLTELTPSLGRLRIRCSVPCNVAVDGQATTLAGPMAEYDGFVDPGAHQVSATWSNRVAVTRDVAATANQTADLAIDAPPVTPAPTPEPATPPATVTVAPATTPPPAPPPPAHGLSPVVVGIGAGLTLISAGVLIGSGIDTLNAASVYRQDPTEQGYIDGTNRETRTNVAIAITGVLGVATIATALFATNWGGSSESSAHARRVHTIPTLVLDGSRIGIGLLGSF